MYKVSRKFIDLPGTNSTRGLNSVPLTMPDEFDINVLYSHKQAILGGVGSNDKSDPDATMYDFVVDADDDMDANDVQDAVVAATTVVQV